MEPEPEDPARCLTEEGQWTEPWEGSEDGEPCDKCGGGGSTSCTCWWTSYTCWSCRLTGARPDCPACAGRVTWEERCPVCRGTGEIDGRPRHGVSVFPTAEGLYHYMLDKGTDVDDSVVVEVEGERSDEVDFDADQGALLVIPTEVVRTESADAGLAERVRDLSAAGELRGTPSPSRGRATRSP